MNELELYESLKSMPKDVLFRYAQNPMGGVPQYMAIAALQYQKDMEEVPAQAPTTTVAEDIVQNAFGIPSVIRNPAQQEQAGAQQEQAPQEQQEQPQPEEAPVEDQGVASLPVPDTMFQEQSMAGGGIVAFDDGGDVKGFAGTDGKSLVSQPGTPIGRWFSGIMQGREEGILRQQLINEITRKYGTAAGPFGGFMTQSDPERQQAKDIMSRLDSMSLPELQALAKQGPSAAADIQGRESQFLTERQALQATPISFAPPTAPAGPSAVQPPVDRVPQISVPRLPPAAALPQIEAPQLQELDTYPQQEALGELKGRYTDWEDYKQKAAAEREAAGIKDIYPKQFAQIVEEQNKLAQEKEKSGWLALAEAGFAAAAGTSPYALTNIGAGAVRGIASLKDAQKELRQSERELRREGNALSRDQQSMLEARLRGDKEGYRQYESDVFTRQEALQRREDQNVALKNQTLMWKAGIDHQDKLAEWGANREDQRLIIKLTADAAANNAQLKMLQKRIDASDRATAASLAKAQAAVVNGIYKDEAYSTGLQDIVAKYKDKGGLSNPSAQREVHALFNSLLTNRSLLASAEDGSIQSATDLLSQ